MPESVDKLQQLLLSRAEIQPGLSKIDEKQAPLPVYLIFFTYIDTRWRTIVKTGFVYYFYPASMIYV